MVYALDIDLNAFGLKISVVTLTFGYCTRCSRNVCAHPAVIRSVVYSDHSTSVRDGCIFTEGPCTPVYAMAVDLLRHKL